MAESIVDDALWEDFHQVVNMTSRELRDWLRTDASGPHTEALPDRAGTPLGQQVLAILGKRRTDLNHQDAEVMRAVVRGVLAERGTEPEAAAGRPQWRHRLMSMGHDPLRAR
ncbi:DUF3140 domain-containing protein [Nocardia sp. CDC159]|uniref:DUF3140 domain-containing protein n=1 Tax=Nocardia pulmonis TaxID=2951408 RepID=A0A9X2IV72_9NOCA|nr:MULTISPECIES: DUF3140 domain-containing protein [Nocardia]MCM6772134.1 DUF3140 domain-containing protein [Nocardia pulmonis]MCM6785208.1 DUF3140 domain-containing protein [Nocardia sp. CDC159]